MKPLSKSSVSPSRARLIESMQKLGYGTIECLIVRDGEPVLDPPPSLTRDVKFGVESGPGRESDLDDFALKGQVCDLLDHLDSLGNATIRRLEVQDGLPFRMQVEDVTA